jgi:hypothetical protein
MAICHREKNIVIVDCMCRKAAVLARRNRRRLRDNVESLWLHSVKGDRWPTERFRAQGIKYEPAEKPKVEIYKDSLPHFTGQRCELLDHPQPIGC